MFGFIKTKNILTNENIALFIKARCDVWWGWTINNI